jgi:16S rRNA (guanine966-N2)-methyltransferase
MRVISGTAKGHAIKAPRGFTTRPMADKIKGALFSMLSSMDLEWERVLDLYAGSGSLSIEALSRGAEWADLVEKSPRACEVILDNLEHTKFSGRAKVYCLRVSDFLRSELTSRLGKYDIMFVDPPYADPAIEETLQLIGKGNLFAEDAVLAIGHWPRIELAQQYGSLTLVRRRCHGDSCFSIYRHLGGQ